MFDRIAPTYDKLNHILSLSIDKGWRKKATREMGIGKDDLILDLASGTGDMTFKVLERSPECHVFGLDLSGNMLRIAQEKSHKKGLHDRCCFVSGDAYALPFREATFDKAMVAFGIRNMPDIPSALTEVGRVLKSGGILTILEFSMPKNLFEKALYSFYFKAGLPIVGRFISGDDKAYRYLPESINKFLSVQDMKDTITNSGFDIQRSINLFPGISHLYIASRRKSVEEP